MREYAGTQLNGNTLLSSVKYNYEDKTNRLSAIVRNSLLGTQEISFVYGNLTAKQNPDAVYTVKHNGTPVLNYNYDPLGRLLTRTIAPINKTQSFTYKQGGYGENSTSTLVETVTVDGKTKRYTYDANGNIIMVQTNDALECQYQYNSKNELVLYEIQDGINTYSYDNNGNITSAVLWDDTVKTFSYTDPNWPDKLTAFNGNTIIYDAIGNPLTYHDGKVFTWENGRRLATVTKGENSYSYTYDGNGIRTSKNVNGTVTEFIYADGVLLGQTTEDDTLVFLYDESGNKFGFIYNGVYYYYDINLQGDVVGIYNSNGTKVVTYEYDPWGVITNITDTSGIDIGTINPIRYLGYYYDNETGFYYLQSRYYDPNICRFINADGLVSTGQGVLGYNMFAYCNNNPICFIDVKGMGKQIDSDTQTESGYTLCGISILTYGNSSQLSTLDFGHNSKTSQVGKAINVESDLSRATLKFRDVTAEVGRALSPYISMAKKMGMMANAIPLYEPYRYGMFGLLVNHGAAWDIKRKGPWESTIGTKFPGYGALIAYNGMIMTPENLGNYTYGLLGAAFGIPLQTLIDGSVFAAYIGGSMYGGAGVRNEIGDWNYVALGYLSFYFGGY